MNSIEILYQVFRARVSLAAVQESLDEGYSLALISCKKDVASQTHRWLGERAPTPPDEENPGKVIELSWPFDGPRSELKKCKGAVLDLGDEIPTAETLRAISADIPVAVPCLWIYESSSPARSLLEPDSSLPKIYRLDPLDPAPIFCRLLMRAFPHISINVARDYSTARFMYARGLMKRVSRRNAVLAAASSLSAPPIPVVGQIWNFFATTGETMAITASQLRLCLLMAAIHRRPLDFFDRVGELWPIIGSAFGWRALARELVGFVPAAGWAFKTGLAYSGTWMVGESSRLYYEHGEPSDEESLREIKRLSKQRALKEVGEALKGLRDKALAESDEEVLEPSEDPPAAEAEEEAAGLPAASETDATRET